MDASSSEPPFAQIRSQIVDAASSGRLVAGTRLPTVRGFAEELGVAAGTVARAYRELEESGWIETRGRAGTFIAAREEGPSAAVVDEAARFADLARREGLDEKDAIALVRAAFGSRERQAPIDVSD